MSVYEQLENLIIEIQKAKSDILTTDNENLCENQLNQLANECMALMSICNTTVRVIREDEMEE